MTSATCQSGIVASLAGSCVNKTSITITVADEQNRTSPSAPVDSPDLRLVSETARGHGAADATHAN